MNEAYSHECASVGFWPGNGGYGKAAFYAYAYPEPEGFGAAKVAPPGAAYNADVGQFLLDYDAVRTAASPDDALLDFMQSTYEAAADLGRWDRGGAGAAALTETLMRQYLRIISGPNDGKTRDEPAKGRRKARA